jgi:DNA-binding NtrC family response regulator
MSAPTSIDPTPTPPQGLTVEPSRGFPVEHARGVAAELPPGAEILVLTSLDVAEAERHLILRALGRTANNRTAAAALLGMHPRTLRRKLRAMHVAPRKARPADG